MTLADRKNPKAAAVMQSRIVFAGNPFFEGLTDENPSIEPRYFSELFRMA